MKLKIVFEVQVSDGARRAINYFWGRPGMANADQTARHLVAAGTDTYHLHAEKLDQYDIDAGASDAELEE